MRPIRNIHIISWRMIFQSFVVSFLGKACFCKPIVGKPHDVAIKNFCFYITVFFNFFIIIALRKLPWTKTVGEVNFFCSFYHANIVLLSAWFLASFYQAIVVCIVSIFNFVFTTFYFSILFPSVSISKISSRLMPFFSVHITQSVVLYVSFLSVSMLIIIFYVPVEFCPSLLYVNIKIRVVFCCFSRFSLYSWSVFLLPSFLRMIFFSSFSSCSNYAFISSASL